MGRVVAIAGGDLQSSFSINRYAVALTKKEQANVLFIGTASKDNVLYIKNIKETFRNFRCEVKDLSLTRREYTEQELDALLNWADLIYIGGGDTVYMMNCWKKCGLDIKLKNIYRNDSAVLMGISAGAICWFHCGLSDSEEAEKPEGVAYGWANGMLNLYPAAFCPHYDEKDRDIFDTMLATKGLSGLALERDTAFVEDGGEYFFIKSCESVKGYYMVYENNTLKKTELEMQLIE
ncbi:MAG: Type 1 glutamine amidotransferase-like domain-containing protein [Lachnospiraceae bacterium]|nr:Type 1 glutamine amidotransferase-like domain-containing protein [Lachnospiraceae bacterium]